MGNFCWGEFPDKNTIFDGGILFYEKFLMEDFFCSKILLLRNLVWNLALKPYFSGENEGSIRIYGDFQTMFIS